MRPTALALVTATVLAAPLHAGPDHLLTDSVLGIALGLAVVAAYLLGLRWLDSAGTDSGTERYRDRDRRQSKQNRGNSRG